MQNEKELSARIESFRSQKEVMKAQYSAAEAQVRINEAATGLGGKMSDAGAAIERAKAKTEEMQARAAATDELIESGTLEDFTSDRTQLDRELAQMASQSQVDSELAQLKQEVGSGRRAEAARGRGQRLGDPRGAGGRNGRGQTGLALYGHVRGLTPDMSRTAVENVPSP